MFFQIRYVLEALFLAVGLLFFRLLPLDMASEIGGLLARILGPLSRAHTTATRNLEAALPELNERQRKKILRDMWDNIGRVIGEYPHLTRDTMRRRIMFEGIEHLQEVMFSGKGAIFVSGHFANWEIAPLTAALNKVPLVLIYRAANNPASEWVIRAIRGKFCRALYGKGSEGARNMLKDLKAGYPVGMLVDQKMNDGKPIPFFGRDAMTATAATSLAIRMQVPLLLARVVRTDGAYFHVSLEAPINYSRNTDPAQAMLELHKQFEEWIREYPSQWFWVHNRWGNK